MEDPEPICETEQAPFCVEILKRLNIQRGRGYLCDITLVAKEGNEFKAHRNVLSAVSPYFAMLLRSEMREKEEGVVRFEEISASVLELVLEFIYTGHVKIDDEESAKDLITAADYLQLVCLKTVATRCLQEWLTIFNCVPTFYFAEKYQCEELVAKSKTLILENFASVAESDDFLNLEAEEVGSWISSDEICVAAEEDVLKIIQKWIKQNESGRKAKFKELFRHVRPVFLSRDSLLDVVTDNLVRQNHTCLEKVLDAIAVVSGGSEDAVTQSPRKRLETHGIVACGGKYAVFYFPQRNMWKSLVGGKFEGKGESTQMITFRDQLFTFDGDASAERYDPVDEIWSPLRQMRLSSSSKQVAVVRGHIYSYSIYRLRNKSKIERYNVNSVSWENVLTSHEGCREDSCLVATGNCLYIMGGKPLQEGEDYVAKVERFDTAQNKWEDIADMQQARGNGAFGVATQGKIFVAGGFESSFECREFKSLTCEVYSIATNEWQFIGNLKVPRRRGSMVCVNGTLYVLGGVNSFGSPEYTVESYDPTVNEWIQKTTIPVHNIPRKQRPSFKGCALKLSPRFVGKTEMQLLGLGMLNWN